MPPAAGPQRRRLQILGTRRPTAEAQAANAEAGGLLWLRQTAVQWALRLGHPGKYNIRLCTGGGVGGSGGPYGEAAACHGPREAFEVESCAATVVERQLIEARQAQTARVQPLYALGGTLALASAPP